MNPGHWQSPFPQGSSAPRAKPAAQPPAVALGGYTETLPARKSGALPHRSPQLQALHLPGAVPCIPCVVQEAEILSEQHINPPSLFKHS